MYITSKCISPFGAALDSFRQWHPARPCAECHFRSRPLKPSADVLASGSWKRSTARGKLGDVASKPRVRSQVILADQSSVANQTVCIYILYTRYWSGSIALRFYENLGMENLTMKLLRITAKGNHRGWQTRNLSGTTPSVVRRSGNTESILKTQS